jgi:CCR4-NOT transcription complex subunit 1
VIGVQLKEASPNAIFASLLKRFLQFMQPLISSGKLSPPLHALYKGLLRVLLVLLHDFPTLLATHHVSLCQHMPPRCLQMRNLVLSAFPKEMKLMDPFEPTLKLDFIPQVKQVLFCVSVV